MVGTKCRTVLSGVTVRMRSALMPTVMKARASMPPLSGLLRLALHEGLAALHLVVQRRLVDLDDHDLGVDAEILDQRRRDVEHHALLLFVGAAGRQVDGDFRHLDLPLLPCSLTWHIIADEAIRLAHRRIARLPAR